MRYFLLIAILAGVPALADQTPKFLDVVRKSDGTVRFMQYQEGREYCESRGYRLPTARELAMLSASQGARGFMTECAPLDQYCTRFEVVNFGPKHDVDLTLDEEEAFFFSYEGYKTPSGDHGKYHFLSSSVRANEESQDYNVGQGYVTLEGARGILTTVHTTGGLLGMVAVRCVSDK